MEQTKIIDVFNQTKRKIVCIANKHDYIGDGNLIFEEELEIGKQYTMVKGEVKSYGSMVHLEEFPSEYGYQAYLFEELEAYDKDIIDAKYENWLEEILTEAENETKKGKYYTLDEVRARLKEKWKELEESIAESESVEQK